MIFRNIHGCLTKRGEVNRIPDPRGLWSSRRRKGDESMACAAKILFESRCTFPVLYVTAGVLRSAMVIRRLYDQGRSAAMEGRVADCKRA